MSFCFLLNCISVSRLLFVFFIEGESSGGGEETEIDLL